MRSISPYTSVSVHGIVLLVLLVSALAAITHLRNAVWRDEMLVWQDVLLKSPQKARPYYYLGIVYGNRNMTDKAFQCFTRAREIDPSIVSDWLLSASAVNQAIEPFREQAPDQPGGARGPIDATHRMMLVSHYIEQGAYDQARSITNEVLRADPECTDAYLALARIYNHFGQTDQESETYRIAINRGKAVPPKDIIYINQGIIFGKRGRYEEAAALFKEAVKIRNSYHAHFNLSVVNRQMGFHEEARREYEAALQLKQ